jgi:small-conductance mechanosensitive channel
MVAIIAIVVSKILTFIIKRQLKSYKNTKTIPQYIGNIVSVVIFIIAIAVVLSILDISISPILTSLGIAGLVIGLSLQSTLINIIAAIKIISEEKVKIGDYIDDGGAIKGVVEDISLNSTRIRNLNNNIIIVPNAKISDSAVINYARNESKIRIIVPVAISTDLPIDKIKSQLVEIVKDIFKNHEGTYKKREPEV